MPSTPDSRPVVVLGAAGFIGHALAKRLAARGFAVRAVTRDAAGFAAPIEACAAGTLGRGTDWRGVLRDARAVIHLASRAHAPPGDADWFAAERATAAAIAAAAAAVGVERTILLSSIKVLGETTASRPFSAASVSDPRDAYGRAKLAIEEAMRRSAPGLVVIRPPLVYGPGVKGNFRALLRLIARGVPLPLAAIHNRRAFVFRENLIALIETVLTHPAAPAGTFLLRDDAEIGTPQVVREIARRLGRPARLFPVAPRLLRLAAAMVGRGDAAGRLIDSLAIDDDETRTRLGWRPPHSLAEGLDVTCRWFADAEGVRPGGSRL
ncbi:MAG: NAD-dependent epimerase/dehydratase family protein [Alphaproteobacteria bacterium]|nr:NAD-dependent epimerase/dehydratase family protein [Alphaproteobacteria bacterium]